MLLLTLIAAVLALAFANGANDNLKPTATLQGDGSLDFEDARRLATLAQIAGSVASMFWAGELLQAFGGKGLVAQGVVADAGFLVAVAVGATTTVLVATRLGLPVSTTHALLGGLVGAGLVLSPAPLAWSALVGTFVAPLLTSPLLSLVAAAALYPIAHALRRRMGIRTDSCLCIGSVRDPLRVGSDGTLVLARTGLTLSVDEIGACRELYSGTVLGISPQLVADRLQATSALALGFARALNDTPKILALAVAGIASGLDGQVSLAVVATAMAVGGWSSSRRVAETLSRRITPIRSGQGLIANSIATGLVIGASLIGSPVSTTHVLTGAILGIGWWNRETDWRRAG